MVDLSVDRVGDFEGIPPYVMGYSRELGEEVSAPKVFFISFHDTHIVKKELVVARHLVLSLEQAGKKKEKRKFDKMAADNTVGCYRKGHMSSVLYN